MAEQPRNCCLPVKRVLLFCLPHAFQLGKVARTSRSSLAELRKFANAVIPLSNDSLYKSAVQMPPSNVLLKLDEM